ncbi:hypothetical protein [Xenophilus sp. Marseille-Q4582]|uniref:hypothetical protein n=1 Tax=Xenophilus sp. Marseille-Q4582 TaxID=2866600 RepID=UPI001CE3D0E3|nr:hypothetical protein [Xenophilus sp. Marseille-Q4582]
MSATLRTVAIDLVGQYNAAGKHLLNAWRRGAGRLIEAPAAAPQLPFVSEEIRTQVAGARDKFAAFLTERLEADVALAGKLMDTVAQRATGGIDYVAAAASRVESEPGASVLRTLHDLHLPFAQLSLKLAGTVAEGAGKLEARVSQAESEAVSTVPVKAVRRTRAAAAEA